MAEGGELQENKKTAGLGRAHMGRRWRGDGGLPAAGAINRGRKLREGDEEMEERRPWEEKQQPAPRRDFNEDRAQGNDRAEGGARRAPRVKSTQLKDDERAQRGGCLERSSGQKPKGADPPSLHLGINMCYIYIILSKFLPLFDLSSFKAIWDKTLEMRFLLQKAFSTSNKLPQEPIRTRFCNHDKQIEQAYDDLLNSSKHTLRSMMELQEALLESNQATKDANVAYVFGQSVAISARGERPEDWVPPEDVSAVYYAKCDDIDETLPMGADGNDGIVDIFSAHSYYDAAGHNCDESFYYLFYW
ncbi:Magnesium/proton exchanger 1 [Zea mays]|uniref:Magnesium/proton exchanger 1 n=1 Tax=Zea mays TaxID=4577 RepID=A0A3L6D671_MAIZE|nr:Magnesium/proton exchanger 1 [Zea mays]